MDTLDRPGDAVAGLAAFDQDAAAEDAALDRAQAVAEGDGRPAVAAPEVGEQALEGGGEGGEALAPGLEGPGDLARGGGAAEGEEHFLQYLLINVALRNMADNIHPDAFRRGAELG